MSDQTDNSQGQQPTHEAARVVIPFDIDMTEVNRKVDELERRVKALFENKSQQGSSVQLQQAPAATSTPGQPTSQDQQLAMVAIQNISLMVRDIRDTLQLIRTDLIENG